MNPEETPVVPKEYYEQLVAIGRENLCEGKYVEGMGYVLPEIEVTAVKRGNFETFYDITVTTNVVVVDPNKPDTIPFFVMEAKYKTVYDHHVKAITMRNKPTFLTYDSNKLNAEARRKAATDPYPVIPGNVIHRDEYPYATTKEGGLGASVEYVDAQHNRRHGREVGSIARTFKMRTNDVFEIILVPANKQWEPQKQPVYIPELEREKLTFPHPNPVPTKTILTWGAVATALATLGKVLDIISSRALFIIMPLDPSFYQNQYQKDENGNIIPPSS